MTASETSAPFREVEVCVIGGGPAGALAARALALLGHDVLLLEGAPLPRPHVGVCLSPGVVTVLDRSGLSSVLGECSAIRAPAPVISWGSNPAGSSGSSSLVVDRGRFDLALLRAAHAAGAQIVAPVRAGRPLPGEDGYWRIPLRPRSCGGSSTLPTEIRSRFLVDAAGRSGLLPARRLRTGPPLLCSVSRWTSAGLPPAVVEALADGWLWGSHLPDGTFTLLVFFQPHTESTDGSRLHDREVTVERLLCSSLLARTLRTARRLEPDRLMDASSFRVEQPAGNSFVRVGDASCTTDPLSGQGVQAALTGALQGAIVAHTILRRPGDAARSIEFYRGRQHRAATAAAEMVSGWYAEAGRDSGFWIRRSRPASAPPASTSVPAPNTRLKLSALTRLAAVAVIEGEWVAQSRALCHPSLPEPIAYWNGHRLSTLLEAIPATGTAAEFARCWAGMLGSDQGGLLLGWLLRSEILEIAE